MAGLFLGLLAGPESSAAAGKSVIVRVPHDLARWAGASAIWAVTTVGSIAGVAWAAYRLKHPSIALVARRNGEDRVAAGGNRGVREEDLRIAIARLLGIPAEGLTSETRFHDDLKIPPGELLDVLGELEDKLDLDLSAEKVRTFGDLLANLNR